MILFLGPRSKLNKSVGLYASAAADHSAAAPAVETPQKTDKKTLSRNCTLEFADIPAERWARLVLSEAEMDCINQGTNDITIDWKKIKL